MKLYLLLFLALFGSLSLNAQVPMNLLGTWNDSTLVGSSAYNNTYNEIWGMVVNDREYAIIGSTFGTHIIDVTSPTNPTLVTTVKGGTTGNEIIHRDYHDYKGYLYAVSDEGFHSGLQIIDTKYLPDSVHVVYDSKELINRSHNIFIDSSRAKLYSLSTRGALNGYSAMSIFDIASPTEPVLLGSYKKFDNYTIGHVHDAYVKNDTAYLNCGNKGLVLADFSDPDNINTINILKSTDYPQSGYNHSGWITDDGKYYVMADETWGTDIKIFDVQNLPDIDLVTTFNANSTENQIAHNQLIKNNYLYCAYYYDGLQIWDLEDPSNPDRTHYFHSSTLENNNSYKGAWGVYPFLPSGTILLSDMQNGLFILEGIDDANAVDNHVSETLPIHFYPNPATDFLQINLKDIKQFAVLEIHNINGQLIHQSFIDQNRNSYKFDIPSSWNSGLYIIQLKSDNKVYKSQFVKN